MAQTLVELQRKALADIHRDHGHLDERPAAALRPSQLVVLTPTSAPAGALLAIDGADGRGGRVHYELVGDTQHADEEAFTCTADGAEQTWSDPTGLVTGGSHASASAWFACIAQHVADALARQDSRWSGDDVEIVLARTSMSIVAFDERRIVVPVSDDAAQVVQSWCDELFASAPVRPLVHAVSPAFMARSGWADLMEDRHFDEDGTVQSPARLFPISALAAFYEGSTNTAHDSRVTLPLDAVRPYFVDEGELGSLVVELPGVPTVLNLPLGWVLDAGVDGDGSEISLTASVLDNRREELLPLAAWRVEWPAGWARTSSSIPPPWPPRSAAPRT